MSDQHTVPPFKGSIFAFLASLFSRHNVNVVLVGGYAFNASGVQRMTFDIDFATTAEGCAAIEPELLESGYEVFKRTDAFVQYKGEKALLRDLDILLLDKKTLDALIKEGRKFTIAGETFVVPAVKHLIAMKLHALSSNKQRELKDFPDIVQLISANSVDPGSGEIREIFIKYNAMEIYGRVLKATGGDHGA